MRSSVHEEDPADHLRLEVVVLEVELEVGVVRLGDVHEDSGTLEDAQRALALAVVEELWKRILVSDRIADVASASRRGAGERPATYRGDAAVRVDGLEPLQEGERGSDSPKRRQRSSSTHLGLLLVLLEGGRDERVARDGANGLELLEEVRGLVAWSAGKEAVSGQLSGLPVSCRTEGRQTVRRLGRQEDETLVLELLGALLEGGDREGGHVGCEAGLGGGREVCGGGFEAGGGSEHATVPASRELLQSSVKSRRSVLRLLQGLRDLLLLMR